MSALKVLPSELRRATLLRGDGKIVQFGTVFGANSRKEEPTKTKKSRSIFAVDMSRNFRRVLNSEATTTEDKVCPRAET